MKQSQFGRTMLETIMVMGIIGVLSVVGIYMYKDAMNGVRADGIVKDVLLIATQNNANMEASHMGSGKRVYTPKYGGSYDNANLSSSKRISGRYGYSFEVIGSISSWESSKKVHYIVVKTSGKQITPAVCASLKGKMMAYNRKDGSGDWTSGRIVCMSKTNVVSATEYNCPSVVNIIGGSCPSEDSTNFYFAVKYLPPPS